MSILCRCKKLVPSVYKSSILLEQSGVFRSVCSSSKAQCRSPCLPRRLTPISASQWHHVSPYAQSTVFSCHPGSKRCYSEVYGGSSDSEKGPGESPQESQDTGSGSKAPTQKPPETFSLDVLVSLLRQENAVDICVIKVPDEIHYTDYFIVVSGVSKRHLNAMALYAVKVYKFLKKAKEPHVKIEGKDTEDWMCIDFGKMVVHFMLPETREVYELEKLWTLRSYDDQLRSIPAEILPEDFIYDIDVTK